jgi:hypothetical protein
MGMQRAIGPAPRDWPTPALEALLAAEECLLPDFRRRWPPLADAIERDLRPIWRELARRSKEGRDAAL